MSFKSFACVIAVAATAASSAFAQGPSLNLVNPGDGTLKLQVIPDSNFLSAALAAEIAIEISGGATLQSATIGAANGSRWSVRHSHSG